MRTEDRRLFLHTLPCQRLASHPGSCPLLRPPLRENKSQQIPGNSATDYPAQNKHSTPPHPVLKRPRCAYLASCCLTLRCTRVKETPALSSVLRMTLHRPLTLWTGISWPLNSCSQNAITPLLRSPAGTSANEGVRPASSSHADHGGVVAGSTHLRVVGPSVPNYFRHSFCWSGSTAALRFPLSKPSHTREAQGTRVQIVWVQRGFAKP